MLDSRDVSAHAVLVLSGGPAAGPEAPPLRSTSALFDEWNELYPGSVLEVLVVRETGRLPNLVERRRALLEDISTLELKQAKASEKVSLASRVANALFKCCSCKCRCTCKCHCFNASTKKVGDVMQLLMAKRQRLDATLEKVEASIVKEHLRYSAATNDLGRNFIVVFNNLRDAAIAKQVLNTDAEHVDRVLALPLATDLCWGNLQPSGMRRAAGMRMVVLALYLALLFFYSVPVTAVTTMMSLQELEENHPWLKNFLDSMGDEAASLFTAWVPTVILLIFMALLPIFCLWLSSLEGFPSHSLQERSAFDKLFLFEFTWVFLGVSITNGLVTSLRDFVDTPLSTLEQVGSSLSRTSVFFMIYLSLQACFTLPLMNMIRLLHLLKAFAIGGWHWAGRPPPADTPPYHLFWAKSMLGATVGISFAAINPIAVLFALAYLCGCYALFCKNLLFDFTNHHDSCGRVMWPSASKWCAAPVRGRGGVHGRRGCRWREWGRVRSLGRRQGGDDAY